MMYHAAIAGKGVDAVVYVGMNNGEMYPTWFDEELLDGALIIDNAGTVAIYLFDEFDAIGSKRSMDNDVGEMRRVLNSFLQYIEEDDSASIRLAELTVMDPQWVLCSLVL